MKRVEADGWRKARQSGSHRQYKHPHEARHRDNRGTSIDGRRTEDLKEYPGTSGAKVIEYAVVYEKTKTGYSAYVPDLPGCIAGGKNLRETASLMRKAIRMHIEAMTEDGSAIPPATTVVKSVPVGTGRHRRRPTSTDNPRRATRHVKRGIRRSRVRAL